MAFSFKTIICQFGLGLSASLAATACIAGSGAGQFGVIIVLNPPSQSGVCVSQTSSEQTNALVRIVCTTGQYVSIIPIPGKPFLATHGGAFRYNLQGGQYSTVLPAGANSFYPGAGTVTALRIYNANGSDGPLEMLVSF